MIEVVQMGMFFLQSVTFIGSLAVGILAGILVFSLGLILYPAVHIPLFLAVTAWYTAIGALWAERLTPSPNRAGLWKVVGFSEALATLLCVCYFVFQTPIQRALTPPIILLLIPTAILALGSTLAVWNFRQDGRDPRLVLHVTLYGIPGSIAFTALVVVVSAYLGWAGA